MGGTQNSHMRDKSRRSPQQLRILINRRDPELVIVIRTRKGI